MAAGRCDFLDRELKPAAVVERVDQGFSEALRSLLLPCGRHSALEELDNSCAIVLIESGRRHQEEVGRAGRSLRDRGTKLPAQVDPDARRGWTPGELGVHALDERPRLPDPIAKFLPNAFEEVALEDFS